MNYYELVEQDVSPINAVEEAYINKLVKSICRYGFVGTPIFVCKNGLITGSHRLEALNRIAENYNNMGLSNNDAYDILINSNIALDITDIIDNFCSKNGIEYSCLPLDVFNDYSYQDFLAL